MSDVAEIEFGEALIQGTRDERQMDIEHDVTGTKRENVAKVGGIAADQLRSLVERIEHLEDERKARGEDIKDIYQEAKSAGFNVKVMRELIRIRKAEASEVEEQQSLLDTYMRALGM